MEESVINEIRLGNFLFIEGEERRVTSKDLVHFPAINSGFDAIKLTVDWIERLGFEYLASSKNSKTYFLRGVQVDISDDSIKVFYFRKKVKDIEFVHQIQNIFFSLTGKELIHKVF